MADEKTAEKPALVLHLQSGGEPLLFALDPAEAERLEPKLPQFAKNGSVETVQTKDGLTLTVNFAHVAVTYLDDLQRKGKVFGMH